MTRHDNLVHLLEMLQKKARSVREISAYLKVNERTVFRYLDKIEKDGHGLQRSSGSGHSRLYFVDPPDAFPPRLLIDLHQMDDDLAGGGNHRYSKLLKEVLRRLNPDKPEIDPQRKLQTIDPNFHIDHGPLAEEESKEHITSRLLEAVHQRKVLKLKYGSKEHPELLLFRPYRLSLRVGALYLLGVHDEHPEIVVSLRVMRILNITSTAKIFGPTDFDPDEYYKYCFGQWRPRKGQDRPQKIVLEIHEAKDAWVERLFAESHFHPPAKLFRRDGFPRISLELFISPDFENWLMGLVPHIRVLKPDSLKDRLLERLKQGTK